MFPFDPDMPSKVAALKEELCRNLDDQTLRDFLALPRSSQERLAKKRVGDIETVKAAIAGIKSALSEKHPEANPMLAATLVADKLEQRGGMKLMMLPSLEKQRIAEEFSREPEKYDLLAEIDNACAKWMTVERYLSSSEPAKDAKFHSSLFSKLKLGSSIDLVGLDLSSPHQDLGKSVEKAWVADLMEERIGAMLDPATNNAMEKLPAPARQRMVEALSKEEKAEVPRMGKAWVEEYSATMAEYEYARRTGAQPDFAEYVREMLGDAAHKQAIGMKEELKETSGKFLSQPIHSFDSLSEFDEAAAKHYGVAGWLERKVPKNQARPFLEAYRELPDKTQGILDSHVSYRPYYDARPEVVSASRENLAAISEEKADRAIRERFGQSETHEENEEQTYRPGFRR